MEALEESEKLQANAEKEQMAKDNKEKKKQMTKEKKEQKEQLAKEKREQKEHKEQVSKVQKEAKEATMLAAEKAKFQVKAGWLLTMSARNGDIQECRRVLDEVATTVGRDAEQRVLEYTYAGSSAIIWASSEGHSEIVEMLEAKGANVNAKGLENLTSLIWASGRGRINACDVLLSKGANVNDQSTSGTSALQWASQRGHTTIVKMLLYEGASIYAKTKSGQDCFSLAHKLGHHRLGRTLQRWPLTMTILVLQAMALYYQLDAQTIIDLHQYLGNPSRINFVVAVPVKNKSPAKNSRKAIQEQFDFDYDYSCSDY